MAFCQSLDEAALDIHAGPDLKFFKAPAAEPLPATPETFYAVEPVADFATERREDPCWVVDDTISEPPPPAPVPENVLATSKNYDNQVVEMAQRLECETLKRLETPRTREACRRLGIKLDDLQAKTLQHFKGVGDSVERVRMRFNHYETKRQGLLKKVLKERGTIVAERLEQRSGSHRMTSLNVMEDMLDKEAKRLEKELKSQARCHNAIEKENETIMQKEKALRDRLQYRSERNYAKKRLDEERGEMARIESQSRAAKVSQRKSQHQLEEQNRQATYLAHRMEDEMRLMDFDKDKENDIRERIEQRELHKAQIDKMREVEDHERQTRALELAQRMEEKSEMLNRKREEMAQERDIKAEESNLRYYDVMERKDTLARQQDFKREQVGKQLREDDTRIYQLGALKEQLVEKRKMRQRQVAVAQGHTGRQIAPPRAAGPGPAAYNTREAFENAENYNRGGVKISTGNTKALVPNSIDEMIARSSAMPAPGSYDPKTLTKGGKSDLLSNGKSTFATATCRTYIEEEEMRAARVPGPGSYSVEQKGPTNGAKMVRDYVPTARDHSSWVAQTDTPGPAAYALDPFLRKERAMKYQGSLPTLYPTLRSA